MQFEMKHEGNRSRAKVLSFKPKNSEKGKADPRVDAIWDFLDAGGSRADAFDKLVALIDFGCNDAYFLTGLLCEMGGNDLAQNFEKAFFYYKTSAETTGLVEANLGVARLYYRGRGVEQDFEKAFSIYSQIAKDKNNPVACLVLGRMYLFGHGVDKDLSKARTYLEEAAGNRYAFAYAFLAVVAKEERRMFQSIIYKLKAAALAILLRCTGEEDVRLRSS